MLAEKKLRSTTLRADPELIRTARYLLDKEGKTIHAFLVEQLECYVRGRQKDTSVPSGTKALLRSLPHPQQPPPSRDRAGAPAGLGGAPARRPYGPPRRANPRKYAKESVTMASRRHQRQRQCGDKQQFVCRPERENSGMEAAESARLYGHHECV